MYGGSGTVGVYLWASVVIVVQGSGTSSVRVIGFCWCFFSALLVVRDFWCVAWILVLASLGSGYISAAVCGCSYRCFGCSC